MFEYFQKIWRTHELRKKILFVLFGLIIFRIAAHIPVPWVNTNVLTQVFGSNSMLWVFSALTWGNMEKFSIVMMWLAPYINASIIMQLMTVVIPALERLNNEDWEEWRKKINSITRWISFPLALLQSYWMLALINMSAQANWVQLLDIYDFSIVIPMMVIIATWTIFVMWLWEIMTEKWIWNWISLIIFAWIVSAMPTIIWNILNISQYDSSKVLPFILFLVITVILLVLIVLFSEAQRNIPITYASAWNKASKWSLPIRLNQAWMIPIIFAIAIITFPSVIAQFMQSANWWEWASWIWKWILENLSWNNPSWTYILMYFLLVLWFTYFYVSVTFKPDKVAENIQKRWGFITWLRPWSQTAEFIKKVSFNMNFWGGSFLAWIAILPLIFTKYTDLAQSDLLISWSRMIIVVWVVLELLRQINAQLVMHDYEKLNG